MCLHKGRGDKGMLPPTAPGAGPCLGTSEESRHPCGTAQHPERSHGTAPWARQG